MDEPDSARPLTPDELATLCEVSTTMLGVAGFDGRFRWVNPAFHITLGYSSEELLSTPYLELIHPDDVNKVVELLGTLSDTGGGPSIDVRVRHRDGSWRIIRSAATSAGDRVYFSAADLTEEHRHADNLAQANSLLGLFGVGVAHDLRSILSIIEGSSSQLAYLALHGAADAEMLEELSLMLERSIARAWVFIGALLAVARGEPVDRVEVPLAELVQGAAEDAAKERASSGASIRFDPAAPMVWVSPVLFQATLANLFTNSMRYCAAGVTPEIDVTTRESGTTISVSVTDNGVGIAAADLAAVFEPFERRELGAPPDADASLLRKVPSGYGLGLALCQRVVQAHGGRVWATSELGKGTTITIELPTAPAGARSPGATHLPDP